MAKTKTNPATGRKIKAAKESEGKLTTAGRTALQKGQFALPPTAEEKRRGQKGSYPIPDKAHARNALARVAQHGTSAEQAAVKRKVHAKYPGIEVGGSKKEKRHGTQRQKR